MFQGTGSDVGKSLLVAGLCRAFSLRGLKVAPFKPQNMSNNAAVTVDGGEIGRAQALQARACGLPPSLHMNPVLLKPQTDVGAQVVVQGKVLGNAGARDYHTLKPSLLPKVLESFRTVAEGRDLVLVEGAGSAAEVNLRAADIANMGFAEAADVPVILVADIDRGGVIASLIGTHALLPEAERKRIKGFIINKFRGDLSLLDSGIEWLEAKTGKRVLGVLPFVPDLAIPEEDAFPETKWKNAKPYDPNKINVEVILLPHISNATDFDSLEREPDVIVHYLARVPASLEPPPDLLILPGSKSTIADLAYLRSEGFAEHIYRCHDRKVPVAGICGGFQMLGKHLLDPRGVESDQKIAEGLGLLDLTTTFENEKRIERARARSIDYDSEVEGYEIHMGQTQASESIPPMFRLLNDHGRFTGRVDGARSEGGLVWGTYIHGAFDAASFRRKYLNSLRHRRGWQPLMPREDSGHASAFNTLSTLVRNHFDLNLLHRIVNQGG